MKRFHPAHQNEIVHQGWNAQRHFETFGTTQSQRPDRHRADSPEPNTRWLNRNDKCKHQKGASDRWGVTSTDAQSNLDVQLQGDLARTAEASSIAASGGIAPATAILCFLWFDLIARL